MVAPVTDWGFSLAYDDPAGAARLMYVACFEHNLDPGVKDGPWPRHSATSVRLTGLPTDATEQQELRRQITLVFADRLPIKRVEIVLDTSTGTGSICVYADPNHPQAPASIRRAAASATS